MNQIILDFQQAKAKHLQFKSRLRSILYGEVLEDEAPVTSQYECPVGKWIYGHALFAYKGVSEVYELERVHADIHLKASELVKLYKDGHVEEARRGLSQMEDIADNLVGLLQITEHKINNDKDVSVIKPPTAIEYENITTALTELLRKNEFLDKQIKEQSNALLANEQLLYNFFMQAPGFVCILKGKEHTFELANAAYVQLVGNRNPVGKTIKEALPELEGQGFNELLDNVFYTQKPYTGKEIKIILDGGDNTLQEAYIDFIYQPIINSLHETEGILVSGYDVTEQVLARLKVEDAEARLRMAAEGTGLGTWDLDLKTHDIIYSPRLNQLFGYPLSYVLKHSIMRQRIHPDDVHTVVEEAFERAMQTGVYDYEARVVWTDETVHWIKTQGKVIFNEANEPQRMLGTMMDITEKKMNEEALLQSEERYRNLARELEQQVADRTHSLQQANTALEHTVRELERSNTELASFNYIASHDLQEPLRKIQTFSKRISDKARNELPDVVKDYFDRINAAASRMQHLIEALLNYSRIDNTESLCEPADLNVLLKEVENNLHDVIEEKGAVIQSQVLPQVQVVPLQFHQLFLNLIDNAIKYSKETVAPIIKITTEILAGSTIDHPEANGEKHYHRIMLTDNGIGFDQEYEHKIFQLFQRLHKGEYTGTGIGLAICKKIVSNHEGFITANGQVGIGSTFNIYIPVKY